MPTEPVAARWTHHALDKAQQFGIARQDVEAAVLERHRERRRNSGEADWQISTGRLVIVYEHPDGDDPLAARIVTLWRRR